MAFGRGRVGETGSEISGAIPVSTSDSASPAGLSAFIDQGSEFEGKLSFKDTVRIDGRFLGEISSENTLVVGESGDVMAQIKSQNVIVSGAVTGNIIASRKVVLHKTARVEGDIETASLVMEDGAWLQGKVLMPGARRETQRDGKPPKATDGGVS